MVGFLPARPRTQVTPFLLLMDLPGLSSPGLRVQDEVWHSFGLPVCTQVLSSDSFALVVSFGCYKFRLAEDSVGQLLQATIGGTATHFFVSQLSSRVFMFFVSSQKVGLFIRCLVSFECIAYKLFFHLWGGGGLN